MTRPPDTIILAAGRGERLQGITPPYHKPLLLHQGVPLVKNAAQIASKAGSENIIVVAAPENAQALSSVLPEGVHIVIQRSPRGPGDAVSIGLRLVETEEVVILLGDNTLTESDVVSIMDTRGNSVGIRMMPVLEVEKYTRYRSRSSKWVEKIPVTSSDISRREENGAELAAAWVGPMEVETDHLFLWLENLKQEVVHTTGVNIEIPLGAILNTAHFTTVEVSSRDLGTPEAVR